MKYSICSSLTITARCLRTVVVVPALGWALLPAFAQVDDFNDGNDNGWLRTDPVYEALVYYYGPGWTPYATWSFTNGGYRIQSDPSPEPSSLGPSRAGSYWTNAAYVYTNFYVSVDVLPWGTTTNQAAGILGRIQNNSAYGATYAYTMTYEPYVQDFQITAFNGGAFSQLVVQKVDLSPTNSHRLVFTGAGSSLEGRIYVLPDVSNPAATISTTDTTYAQGWCGLLTFSLQNHATDVTYDNYVALPEPPATLSVKRSGNEVWVSWPVGVLTYTLQSSSTLPSQNWTPITTGITQSNGQNIYKTTPAGTVFYRLVMK